MPENKQKHAAAKVKRSGRRGNSITSTFNRLPFKKLRHVLYHNGKAFARDYADFYGLGTALDKLLASEQWANFCAKRYNLAARRASPHQQTAFAVN